MDPFSYIGFHNLRKAAEGRGITIEWKGFEFNPETPLEGFDAETGANSELRPGMWASVRNFAERSGLQLLEPARIPNTRRAHQLVYFATQFDVKNLLIDRIYQAYFTGRQDIGQIDVLTSIARDCSLPADSLDDLWTRQAYAEQLERNKKEAMSRQFPGLPGFIWKGWSHFGALPLEYWLTQFTNPPKETHRHV